MLSSKNMRLGSNLFHIGIIVIFFGHLVGMQCCFVCIVLPLRQPLCVLLQP